jgi:hypothetical protein
MSKNRNPNTELDPKGIHPMRKLSDHKYRKNLPTNLQCSLSYRNIVHNRRLANSRKPKIKTKKKQQADRKRWNLLTSSLSWTGAMNQLPLLLRLLYLVLIILDCTGIQ